jgi:4-hydroxymandelate oxidase
VLVAPTALQGMAHPDGEVATARAAGRAGTIMTLSTLSNFSVEEVRAATSGPLWLQLYVYKDRGVTRELLERARAAGCDAIVLTADAPFLGRRERDVRNAFRMPPELSIPNVRAAALPVPTLPEAAVESGLAAYVVHTHDASLTWRDLEWVRAVGGMPVLVKGIVRGDDAERAVEHGAVGVVVSNHGGRQLDTAPATIDVLPEVVDAVAGRAEVLLDGGVRRGTDVLKALALGARAVMIGRPVLWGLAVAGEAGVTHVLRLLREELDLAMALAGCAKIGDIARDLVMVQR